MSTSIQYRSLLLLVAVILCACGGPAARPSCEASETANLRIVASDHVNPNEEGRPLPTIVRIYQLANIGEMETADFEDIHTNDEETLGEAFLGKDEVVVFPNSTTNRPFERNPDANFIVGVGIFRRPAGVSWRTILELPPPAAEAECAALQENPDEPPPEQPAVFLGFELDDYIIEGTVRLEYPPPPCAEGDPICAAERAAAEQAEGAGDAAGEAGGEAASSAPTGP